MKYVIVLLALVTGLAHSQPSTIVNKSDPNYMRSMGSGKTFNDAKSNAFKNAISFIVGSAILSQQESQKNQLIKDEIIEYSAGYIDRYEVIDSSTTSMGVTVIVDVIVRSSKIHERLLNASQREKQIDGDRLSTQYTTYIAEQQSGDKFLNAILIDYPARAFEIKQGNHEFKVDSNRNAMLVIPFELKWNYRYLVALNEALSQVSQGDSKSVNRIVVTNKEPGSFFLKKNMYYFNDSIKAKQIKNAFNSDITLQLKINDNTGNIIFADCYTPGGNFAGLMSNNDYVLFGNEVEKDTVQVKLRANNKILEQSNNVQLSIESKCFRKS